MAAISFTKDSVPDARRFQLGSADVATKVNKHTAANKLTVNFEGAPGKVAFTGTDGQAIDSNYIVVPADTCVEIAMGSSLAIYLASAVASTNVSVVAEK